MIVLKKNSIGLNMNKEDVLQKVKDYAVKNGLNTLNLYNNCPGLIQYEDVSSLQIEQLSSVLSGSTLLRKKELIEEVLPFIRFDNSKHYYDVILTYAEYLSNNKDCFIQSLKQHKELFNEFSIENKEIYFMVKNILFERISELEDMFKPVLEKRGPIIKRNKSISYNLDLNEFVNLMKFKSFSVVSNQVYELLYQLKNNGDFNEYFGVEDSIFDKGSKSNFVIHFLINKNEDFMDSFMESLIMNFINHENSLNSLNEKRDFSKLIRYIFMQENVDEKDTKIKKLKL